MGSKLLEYYDKAEKMGGFKAKMRLAILTAMPSNKAAIEADSPDNVKKFEAAMIEIGKEFKQ